MNIMIPHNAPSNQIKSCHQLCTSSFHLVCKLLAMPRTKPIQPKSLLASALSKAAAAEPVVEPPVT